MYKSPGVTWVQLSLCQLSVAAGHKSDQWREYPWHVRMGYTSLLDLVSFCRSLLPLRTQHRRENISRVEQGAAIRSSGLIGRSSRPPPLSLAQQLQRSAVTGWSRTSGRSGSARRPHPLPSPAFSRAAVLSSASHP